MEGDTSSSYWPLLTDQINAKRKPDATIRLARIRIRITLTALICPKVFGEEQVPNDEFQLKT